MTLHTRKGTCDGCGKVRKLTKPPSMERELLYHPDGRRKLLNAAEHAALHKRMIHYYWLCAECYPKVMSQDDISRLRRERTPKERTPRFAYPCIGGPLDGEYAVTDDFYPGSGEPGSTWYRAGGMYAHLSREYSEFNAARGTRKRLGGPPSMVFIHASVLKPLARPKER